MSATDLILMPDNEAVLALEKRVRELETTCARHQGSHEAKWSHQEIFNHSSELRIVSLNEKVDSQFNAVFKKLTALEVKVAIFSSLAAFGGGLAAKFLF